MGPAFLSSKNWTLTPIGRHRAALCPGLGSAPPPAPFSLVPALDPPLLLTAITSQPPSFILGLAVEDNSWLNCSRPAPAFSWGCDSQM